MSSKVQGPHCTETCVAFILKYVIWPDAENIAHKKNKIIQMRESLRTHEAKHIPFVHLNQCENVSSTRLFPLHRFIENMQIRINDAWLVVGRTFPRSFDAWHIWTWAWKCASAIFLPLLLLTSLSMLKEDLSQKCAISQTLIVFQLSASLHAKSTMEMFDNVVWCSLKKVILKNRTRMKPSLAF